ncbi:GrdB-related putative oxidoreductase [Enterococcus sp. HY326]|uniref:GrdB-related putative oxidoreductase n=1 Tax=Enterococcus sp. HY326 TaxID=2971265 RepID=UPI00223ED5BE|nr:GrdB-related putative oxidoreductase [Enterococcus sp. HY326]
MKIIFILDQIQAGLGGAEKGDQPLGGKYMAIGSVQMFENYLGAVNGEVMATLYCGDDYFAADAETNALKLTAMVKKLNPDVVICGPCFNYDKYGLMAGKVAATITDKLHKPVIAAMSQECAEAIELYKDQVDIVKMPKKGGTGLTESMETMLKLCQLKVNQEDTTAFTAEYCY